MLSPLLCTEAAEAGPQGRLAHGSILATEPSQISQPHAHSPARSLIAFLPPDGTAVAVRAGFAVNHRIRLDLGAKASSDQTLLPIRSSRWHFALPGHVAKHGIPSLYKRRAPMHRPYILALRDP